MPVYKSDSGYYVKYRVKDPVTGKSRQITKRGFQTKREASRWEAENKYDTPTSTSSTFWDIFLISQKNNDTSKDSLHKKSTWISMYFADLKDRPIDTITKAELVEWRNSLKERGLAVRTMNYGLQYIRSVFAFYSTVYGGQNTGSVLNSYKMTKEDRTEMLVWTPEEFSRFISAVKPPVYQAFYTFLYWTGCRRGEAIALTKDCFTGNRVHIYRSMKYFKDGFKPLKTDSSERTITIDKETMAILEPFIQASDPFVFGGVHPMPTSKVFSYFKKGIEDSGVTPIRLHDLRHSHASVLLNNGANILAVSKRLGHATVTQTLETYAHLMRESDESMLRTIENLHKCSQNVLK